MTKTLLAMLTAGALFVCATTAQAQKIDVRSVNRQSHNDMDHSTHMQQGMQHRMPAVAPSVGQLTEPGNDVFGTIQEVVNQLLQDSKTNWSQVNIEALRQHLIDMENFTINVQILSQTDIEHGVEIVLKSAIPQAEASLGRALSAHPAMLEQEVGWVMRSNKLEDNYTITITSANKTDVEKIRALGYIGIMTMGSHHQPHHWAIATGTNPHAGQ